MTAERNERERRVARVPPAVLSGLIAATAIALAAEAALRARGDSAAGLVHVAPLALLLAGAAVMVAWSRRARRRLADDRSTLEAELVRKRFEALAFSANDIIVLADATGAILDVNDRGEQAYGYSRDELRKMHIRDLRPAEGIPEADRTLSETLARGGILREALHRRRDGTTFPVEVSTRTVEVDGTPYVQGVVRDITERKRTTEALRHSEARFRRLAENAQDVLYRYRLLPTPGVEYVSPAVERVTGHAAADYVGGALELTHPHDRAKLLEAARGGGPVEVRWVRRDGGVAWTEQRVTAALDAEGRVAAIEGIARDVTEQKNLRARLAVADRLASIGTLAAGVAHEINNPLAYVAANLGFVRDRLGRVEGPEAADLRQALSDALEGATRVRDIVQRLRRFGRPGEARRQPVDARAEIEASISLARNEISHRARLEVELGPLPSVMAAEHELGQVFVNLLLNAAQAIPEGRAAENEVRLVGRTEGGAAVVEVRDTGVGIPPENVRRIFDPFFTTKPPGQGTGLGLSIVHGIVSSLGGTIEVESEPGRGTTFRVRLPATDDVDRPAPAPAAPAPVPRGRVLVLDDEPLVARAIARALEAHDVSELTSPREALRRVEGGERWDVVVCDLMMPEMDGPEFARRVAEAAPEMRERLVFMTGGAFTNAAEEFLDRSGHPYLEKPVDAAALRSMVAARVTRRSA